MPSNVAATYTAQRDWEAEGWVQSGTCVWRVDGSGCLTVKPMPGSESGELGEWGAEGAPWLQQAGSIRTARFEGSVLATAARGMFQHCFSLVSLDLSGLDTSNARDISFMFDGCISLESVKLGKNFSFEGSLGFRQCDLTAPMLNGSTGKWVDSATGGVFAPSEVPSSQSAQYLSQKVLDESLFDVDTSMETFAGKPITKSVGSSLSEGTDYIVSYSDNINAGTARISIAGTGRYAETLEYTFEIAKATPTYCAPDAIRATEGQTLADLELPEGFSWQNLASTPVGTPGNHVFYVVFTPTDTANYNAVRDIPVTVEVAALPPAPKTFTDVDYSSWYGEGVSFCSAKGLISGYADGPAAGTFGVGKPLTRAQLALILWRAADPEAAAACDPTSTPNDTGMDDVESNTWYTGAANWAVANHVINGFDNHDGTFDFAPNEPVTAEQVAKIFCNYAASGEAGDPSALEGLTDARDISDWAIGAVAWARESGLASGYDNHDGTYTFKPGESTTRERAATLIMKAFKKGILE